MKPGIREGNPHSLVYMDTDDSDTPLPPLSATAITLRAGDAPITDISATLARIRTAAPPGDLAIHVRLDLDRDPADIDALLALEPDVISVDVHADDATTYALLTGRDHAAFTRSRANLERLIRGRRNIDANLQSTSWAAATPWIVPRLTRRDEVYEQIDAWFDRWIVIAGHAVIDPLDANNPGGSARIAPLTTPRLARARTAFDTFTIGAPAPEPVLA